MSNEAVAYSRKVHQAEQAATAAKQATVAQTHTTEVPKDNPIFQVMFNANLKPEEKRKEVAQALIGLNNKQKEYNAFYEWASDVRKELAQEIIRLTDTTTYSEIKGMYGELNDNLVRYNDKVKPLTDTTTALFKLRTAGKTFDALMEIQKDKLRRKELQDKYDAASKQFTDLQYEIDGLNNDIAHLSTDRTLFGYGKIKADSEAKITINKQKIADRSAQLTELQTTVEDLDKQIKTVSVDTGEFAEEKKQLQQMLDIPPEKWNEMQRDLVDSAMNFINTATSKVNSVRGHLDQMTGQVDTLFDNTLKMQSMFTILDAGVGDALIENNKLRNETLKAPEGEDQMAKLDRDHKQIKLSQVITALDQSKKDAVTSSGDLAGQAIRVKNMQDATNGLISNVRTLRTEGIAGVADRVSVVMTAVSSAALGEAYAMGKDTIQQMKDSTNEIAQKEMIRQALGMQDTNKDLDKSFNDLVDYGETLQTATKISSEALTGIHERLDKLAALAKQTSGQVQEAIGVHATTQETEQSKSDKPAAPAPKKENPFDQFGNSAS